jgi:NAD(P)-dependent dehydrogenase (short-subunit alcohol dehydrogenase family)
LDATARQCRERGAQCVTDCFDLRESNGLIARLAACDAEAPIDMAIFCAGVGGIVPADQLAEAPLAAQMMVEVNFSAPVIGASVLAGPMAARKQGQIVLIGSIAESFPLPMAPAYAGAKAGLAMFAQALGNRMAPHGVAVTLVSPGFIDTPMSRQVPGPKPFLMPDDRAAQIIARKLVRRPARIVLPWQFGFIRAVSRLIPRPVMRLLLRSV